MRAHVLKVCPEYFQELLGGIKTYEVRFNDRDYQPGDYLLLKEYFFEGNIYTGKEISFEVLNVVPLNTLPGMNEYGIPVEVVIMSLKKTEVQE